MASEKVLWYRTARQAVCRSAGRVVKFSGAHCCRYSEGFSAPHFGGTLLEVVPYRADAHGQGEEKALRS